LRLVGVVAVMLLFTAGSARKAIKTISDQIIKLKGRHARDGRKTRKLTDRKNRHL
jgi:hypothetical protein